MELTEEIAAALDAAERDRTPIAPPSEAHPGLSLAGAYAVQRAVRARREAAGNRVVGHKVGITSQAMQEMLGVDQPDFGYLTEAMVFDSGARLAARALIAPRVEAEIAFRLRTPLEAGPGLDRAAVLAATEAVAPALEIIDSRVADWRIGITDTVADNASSARVVLGDFIALADVEQDLAEIEATMRVVAADGGAEQVTGAGAAVLGHPAEPIIWLAEALATYGGEPLLAGQVVIPGAMARALPIAAGSEITADFGVLGGVRASVVDGDTDERS
jgi:2-keto-4-pentenoate hydratase